MATPLSGYLFCLRFVMPVTHQHPGNRGGRGVFVFVEGSAVLLSSLLSKRRVFPREMSLYGAHVGMSLDLPLRIQSLV